MLIDPWCFFFVLANLHFILFNLLFNLVKSARLPRSICFQLFAAEKFYLNFILFSAKFQSKANQLLIEKGVKIKRQVVSSCCECYQKPAAPRTYHMIYK